MPTLNMDADSSDISSPQINMAGSQPTLFDQLFRGYPILTGIMQHLHFYEYRNLRLAGCEVPATSTAIQQKYLVPIYCHEFRDALDTTTQCGKSPPDVEMKPCEGLSLAVDPDDPTLDFDSPRMRHLHDGRDKGKCYWVCHECRNRNQERYENHGFYLTPSFVSLCETHSLEYEGVSSYYCQCCNTAIGDWRCSMCIESSIDMLTLRAHKACLAMPLHVTLLGIWSFILHPHMEWTVWLLWKSQRAQDVFNKFISSILWTVGAGPIAPSMLKLGVLCPIEDCTRAGWHDVRGLEKCLLCKAICLKSHANQ